MIEDTWKLVGQDSEVHGCPVHQEVRPAKGKVQYIRVVDPKENSDEDNGEKDGDECESDSEGGQQMMLVTDMVLLWDPEFKPFLEKYAESEDLLREDFGKAWIKLTNLGYTEFPDPFVNLQDAVALDDVKVEAKNPALGCPMMQHDKIVAVE